METTAHPDVIRVNNAPLPWSYDDIIPLEGQWVQVRRIDDVWAGKDFTRTAIVVPVQRLNEGANKLAVPPE